VPDINNICHDCHSSCFPKYCNFSNNASSCTKCNLTATGAYLFVVLSVDNGGTGNTCNATCPVNKCKSI